MNEREKLLYQLTRDYLIERVASGQATAAEVNNAIKMLTAVDIVQMIAESVPVREMPDLPFGSPEDEENAVRRA